MDMGELVHDFERLLMLRHRFALADVVVCVHKVVADLQALQKTVVVTTAAAVDAQDKRSLQLQEALGRVSVQLERAVTLAPTFAGDQELAMFVAALTEFGRLSETLKTEFASDKRVFKLQKQVEKVKDDGNKIKQAAVECSAVCELMSKKRNYLVRFLDEAAQVLENSNSRRVAQYENAIEQFTEDFKAALEDVHLQKAKQLRFGIQSIERSMSTMLLPHFEICRTITTANAHVQASTTSFTKSQCDEIDAFVRTAARLKAGHVTFRRVLQDAAGFLTQLELFEQAASKDSFLVLSSALKLQFRETLDQELFLAYVEDWKAKRDELQSTQGSTEYRAATSRLQELKTAIGRAHELVQISKKKLDLDDPTRTALMQEVNRIFNDEGGAPLVALDALS